MRRDRRLYGLLAEFDAPEALLHAAQRARSLGYRRMDAYSPFQIEGLAEAVGFRFNLLPWLVLAGGFGGAAAGYFLQYDAAVISYPLNIAGRPLNSWPSFVPITFELGVLGAALSAFFALLALCGLPSPYHPIFTADSFDLETKGKFFLCIEASDRHFRYDETRQFLASLGARRVEPVEHWSRRYVLASDAETQGE